MTISAPEQRQNPNFVLPPFAVHVECDDSSLRITLADGRELTTSLAWFPRLLAATDAERARRELIGGGEGVHWPDVDVAGDLEHDPSGGRVDLLPLTPAAGPTYYVDGPEPAIGFHIRG